MVYVEHTKSDLIGKQLECYFTTLKNLKRNGYNELSFKDLVWVPPTLATLFTSFVLENKVKYIDLKELFYFKTIKF